MLKRLSSKRKYNYPRVVGIYCELHAAEALPTLQRLKEQALIYDFCMYPDNELEMNTMLETYVPIPVHVVSPAPSSPIPEGATTTSTAFDSDMYIGPPRRDHAPSSSSSNMEPNTHAAASAPAAPFPAQPPVTFPGASGPHDFVQAPPQQQQQQQYMLPPQLLQWQPLVASSSSSMEVNNPAIGNFTPLLTATPTPSDGAMPSNNAGSQQQYRRIMAAPSPRPAHPS